MGREVVERVMGGKLGRGCGGRRWGAMLYRVRASLL